MLVHILMRFILFFVPNVCRLVQLIIFVLNLREIIRSLTFARFKTIIALSLNSAAYIAEIVRGGIQSIEIGQSEAAKSGKY